MTDLSNPSGPDAEFPSSGGLTSLDLETARTLHDQLMALPAPVGTRPDEAINRLGLLVDLSFDLDREAGNDRALEWAEALETRTDFTAEQRTLFHYVWANAWGGHQQRRHRDLAAAWAWDQPEVARQILHLRTALTSPGFSGMPRMRRCQILTNLANLLNTTGRFVEALELWTRALEVDPRFWEARGNRAQALLHYSDALYDGGHRGVFLVSAFDDLERALANEAAHDLGGHPAAAAHFVDLRRRLAADFDIEELRRGFDPAAHSLGRGKTEVGYRRWALRERLFLNPLNDLGPDPIAANDVLNLASFRLPLDAPPVVIGLYNQMKQEFASARWLLYEALQDSGPHLSDRGVLLINTLDYPAYSLAVEKLKFAFRAAYSIFDKVGFFLNHYLGIGEKPSAVDFRRIWKSKDGALRPAFEGTMNLPLRGLYWLSKDIYEDQGGRLDPDVRALKELRNHLEHRYVKVLDMGPFTAVGGNRDPFADTLALSIGRADFQGKTLRVLKMARAALIYLSLGMHAEERRREEGEDDTIAGPMILPTVRDDWKW